MLRQRLKKLSVLLNISEPEEIEPGVFETRLTHPKLKGELKFVHSEFVGRDETLKALDQNIVGHMLDLVGLAGEIIDAKQKSHASGTASSSAGKGQPHRE
jgi:hypothetical protein